MVQCSFAKDGFIYWLFIIGRWSFRAFRPYGSIEKIQAGIIIRNVTSMSYWSPALNGYDIRWKIVQCNTGHGHSITALVSFEDNYYSLKKAQYTTIFQIVYLFFKVPCWSFFNFYLFNIFKIRFLLLLFSLRLSLSQLPLLQWSFRCFCGWACHTRW